MIIAYAFVGNLPSYALDTVQQLRLFYQGPVYFIISDLESPIAETLRETHGVTIVSYESVKHDEFNVLVERVKHKFLVLEALKGREKLFIYSFERFFLLYNLIVQTGLNSVLFLELDNLIYDDPNEWELQFLQHEMSFMFDNDDRCSSGVCHISSAEILRVFLQYCMNFIEHSSDFINEMTCLFRFAREHKTRVGMLPIHWDGDGVPPEASNGFGLFGDSIFDAASIGIFLGGMDPYHTNNVVKTGLRGRWSLLDYTGYSFKWEVDAKGRRIPYVQRPGGAWIRINNLHIHSKELRACMSL